MWYCVPNLWQSFKDECPVISRIPVFRSWAFGVWVRAYFNVKMPVGDRSKR